METEYGVALRKKEGEEGLDRADICGLYDMLGGRKVYPVEIPAKEHEAYAIGFITEEAAGKLDFEYGGNSRLGDLVAGILDGIQKAQDGCTYSLDGINVWLGR